MLDADQLHEAVCSWEGEEWMFSEAESRERRDLICWMREVLTMYARPIRSETLFKMFSLMLQADPGLAMLAEPPAELLNERERWDGVEAQGLTAGLLVLWSCFSLVDRDAGRGSKTYAAIDLRTHRALPAWARRMGSAVMWMKNEEDARKFLSAPEWEDMDEIDLLLSRSRQAASKSSSFWMMSDGLTRPHLSPMSLRAVMELAVREEKDGKVKFHFGNSQVQQVGENTVYHAARILCKGQAGPDVSDLPVDMLIRVASKLPNPVVGWWEPTPKAVLAALNLSYWEYQPNN